MTFGITSCAMYANIVGLLFCKHKIDEKRLSDLMYPHKMTFEWSELMVILIESQ